MLPGFRFLFAATVLSMSMLIFGFGAAALLRAAHEEVASIPLRRAPPETLFAQPNDAARPTLAMLRVEPPVADSKTQDDAPLAAPSVEQSAIAPTPPEAETPVVASDKIAARDIASAPENLLLSEPPKPESSAPEIPAQAGTPAQTGAPSPAAETKVAAIAEVIPPESTSAPVDDSTTTAQTKIATLGGPPVTITDEAPPKKSAAKSNRSVAKKKAQARRAKERRRIAARARIVQQAPADPFAQPFGR